MVCLWVSVDGWMFRDYADHTIPVAVMLCAVWSRKCEVNVFVIHGCLQSVWCTEYSVVARYDGWMDGCAYSACTPCILRASYPDVITGLVLLG